MTDLKPLERQIRILQLLTFERELTVEQLYEYFEHYVSIRTLQRDLLALRAANVPLEERRGAHGQIFWSLKPNYLKFIPMTLCPEEFVASLLLEKLGKIFANTPIAKDIQNLDQKIKQLVTPDILRVIEPNTDVQNYFAMLQHGYIDYSLHGEQLQKFLSAILEQRICKVTYRSAYTERPKRYKIHPYTLVLFKGAFYGLAYYPKYQTFLHLLIHRIEHLEITDEKFERSPELNPEEYFNNSIGIWHDEPEEVVIEFAPELATKISERIWQRDQQIQKLPNGSILLKLRVAISYELVAWILQWGRLARVISPPRLIDMIISEIKSLQKIYSPE